MKLHVSFIRPTAYSNGDPLDPADIKRFVANLKVDNQVKSVNVDKSANSFEVDMPSSTSFAVTIQTVMRKNIKSPESAEIIVNYSPNPPTGVSYEIV